MDTSIKSESKNSPEIPQLPLRKNDPVRSPLADDPVDVTGEDSFPASDAPSWTVVSGTGSSCSADE